ncbi:MAG: hypothetical protein LBT86_00285 [Deltaproteobacteria bacterium]|nr:hypothetical protein [Deltaproteobacteria bacterium]
MDKAKRAVSHLACLAGTINRPYYDYHGGRAPGISLSINTERLAKTDPRVNLELVIDDLGPTSLCWELASLKKPWPYWSLSSNEPKLLETDYLNQKSHFFGRVKSVAEEDLRAL